MTYPVGAPTLSGDLLTINRMLQSPTYIKRRLRTFQDLRFVSDQLLTQRLRTSGGAVLYEQTEPVINSRAVEAVAPGSEYPRAVPGTGTAALAAAQKWGQASFLSDERIKRFVNGGDELDRTLLKLTNSIINQVDKVTISAISSSVTATVAAAAKWDGTSTDPANMLLDLEIAKAKILDLQQGYNPDTVLMSSTKAAYLNANQVVASLRRREATDNPVYSGMIDRIDGLAVITAPLSNLPSDDVWVLDSRQLGGMADEQGNDPGYTVGEMAIQVQSERIAQRDGWDVWGRRITVPVVMEPGAAIRITTTS